MSLDWENTFFMEKTPKQAKLSIDKYFQYVITINSLREPWS